jgi:aspartate kinase
MSNGLIVQKYGGTSLSCPERIRAIAEKIAERASRRARIIVTVSAMGSSTDELIELARRITPHPPQRELDMLLTVGERISMALLSMALNSLDCRAISFTGSQCGIVTDVSHTRALIEEIRGDRIEEALSNGYVVIVAGFQGVSRTREITTLGRGGSDTTAIALAARLGAERCEIFSDVPGVFTADPRIVADARPLPRITYEEMLELAVLGAKVLHYRAAELARRCRVPLHLLSSFDDSGGTVVREADDVEREEITSVTSQTDLALIRLSSGRDGGILSEFVHRAVESDLRIISYQRASGPDGSSVDLVVERGEADAVKSIAGALQIDDITVDSREDLSSVSIVGIGFTTSSRVVAEVEKALSEAGIPVLFVGTSSLSVTCLVPDSAREAAVEALHNSLISSG